jgi:hypothetical protein
VEKALHLAQGAGAVGFVDKDALCVEQVGKDAGTAVYPGDVN